MAQKQETDLTKLRYVLYARKSTIDKESQIRSLGDQIKDCNALAKQLGLNVLATFKESGSAKMPNNRPIFDQILKDIHTKKYDAILAWHPDRLSRNMLEGGKIIDMLDNGTLKDIQFFAHQFSNDSSGKMLLGLMFVFSKNYVDELSARINRGIEGNFQEGKSSGTPKWGYTRNDITGLYEENEYADLVRDAWYMRAEGKTNKEIVAFLVSNGVQRKTKPSRKQKGTNIRTIYPTEKSIGNMFKDPFYYGVLLQTRQTVDLRSLYHFESLIDQELYNKVQQIGYAFTKDTTPKKNLIFKPMSRMIYCGVCNSDRWMRAGRNKPQGSKHHVLTYRCDNPRCTRSIKSVRAHYIFNAIYQQLEQFELNDDAYERYSKHIEKYTDEKILAIKRDISSKRGNLAHIIHELDKLSLNLGNIEKTSRAYKITSDRIDKLAAKQDELEEYIANNEKKIENPQQIALTKEQFLNLVKTASHKMKAGSAVEKDRLAKILFLNLRVDDKMALTYHWREPFDSLVKAIKMSSGADERT